MKVAAIQTNSGRDINDNLDKIATLITKSYNEVKPDLIALPEMFNLVGANVEEKKQSAENLKLQTGRTITLLKKLAKQFKIFIHGGSLCEEQDNRYYNTTCIIDDHGDIIATYRKINLFQFSSDQYIEYDESIYLTAGDCVVTYPYQNVQIGCTICFDIRFGAIFQELIKKKVNIIVVPSAFTYETGQAHWEILCRARAIETQSFLIAPAQTGSVIENGHERFLWGHTMIVDPWGNILARMGEEEGYISATFDFDYQKNIRTRLPVVNRRNES